MSLDCVFPSVIMSNLENGGGASAEFFKRDYRQGIVPPDADAWDKISRLRINEAGYLVDESKWNGAVYLAGLAVEARLKWLAILSAVATPENVKNYRHNLELLSKDTNVFGEIVSGLGGAWRHFRFWDVQIRYESELLSDDAGQRFFLAASTILGIINAESRKRGYIQ